jgi:hypothetical protein
VWRTLLRKIHEKLLDLGLHKKTETYSMIWEKSRVLNQSIQRPWVQVYSEPSYEQYFNFQSRNIINFVFLLVYKQWKLVFPSEFFQIT